MKNKLYNYLIFISLAVICSFGAFFSYAPNTYAETSPIQVLSSDDKLLMSSYLDLYSISADNFSYSNNGGQMGNSKLSNAFDRNYSTYFESNSANVNGFINYIDINFNSSVQVDRILYGNEPNITRGYPTKLNIYALIDDNLTLIKTFESTATTSMVCFSLDNAVTTTQIRMEFATVATGHRWTATAREIIFLQPENEEFNNLFTDYAQTQINKSYNTFETLQTLENSFLSNVNYESKIKPVFDRARLILNGQFSFNEQYEFSTADKALNKINQYGDIIKQARTVLKMNSFGTNRQVTGLVAKSNTEITIYVEADENDPLPKIRFLQVIGHWRSFISGEYQLYLGKNTITVPKFDTENTSIYTDPVIAGCSIYIINPYTESEQSKNLKLYFENTTSFPVYRIGDNEAEFKSTLTDYYNKLVSDPDNTFDIVEVVANHVILTLTAKNCYTYYINQSYSPKQTVENWDDYMTKLLVFGGVELDKTAKNYNSLNEHLNTNFRVSQVWSGAGAYAYTEHIGIYKSWEATGIKGSNMGWGTAHEIGHAMDIPDRTIGETTNNMWSKYNETAIEKLASRDYVDFTTSGLMNDSATYSNGFFNENRYNYQIWWNIECVQKGFWGRLENCYRGMNEKQISLASDTEILNKINSLSKTERHVLYASLASGIDLSYYFERWGFNMNGESIFNYENSTQNFKDCLEKALELKLIDNTTQPKFWYLGKKAYFDDAKQQYTDKTNVTIKNVFKTASGYSILIDGMDNTNHLGFEILEGNDTDGYKVVGFTRTASFTDTTTYESDYTPTYKIVAYDNSLSYSSSSAKQTPNSSVQENVCQIGDVYYNSLADAIANASAGDTIILLKSTFENNLTIDKNLIITTTTNVTIYRTETGNLITINSGVTLTLTGLENNYITISGYDVSQTGSLIYASGTLNAKYVNFVSNISSGYGALGAFYGGNLVLNSCNVYDNTGVNGGAFSVVMQRGYASSKCTLTNVEIFNNSAEIGAIAYTNGTLTINNCKMHDNTTTGNGSIYMHSGGVTALNSCLIQNNTTNNGGVLFVADGTASIDNSTLKNNRAINNGGAIYMSASSRTLTIKNNTLMDSNTANNGLAIYLNAGTIDMSSTTISISHDIKQSSKVSADVFVNSGKMNINQNCDITSVFTINNGANLTLKNGLFTNIENCLFTVTDMASSDTTTFTLLYADSFELSEQDLEKIAALSNFNIAINNNAIVLEKIGELNESNLVLIVVIIIAVLILCGTLGLFVIVKTKKRKKQTKNVIIDNIK